MSELEDNIFGKTFEGTIENVKVDDDGMFGFAYDHGDTRKIGTAKVDKITPDSVQFHMIPTWKQSEVKRVKFDIENGATIVWWTDKTKTVAVIDDYDGPWDFDPWLGVSVCCAKKMLGSWSGVDDLVAKFAPTTKQYWQRYFREETL